MRSAPPKRPLLFVDACTWINLFATNRIRDILRQLPFHFAVSTYVATKEVLTIRVGQEADSSSVARLDLGELARDGYLSLLDIETKAEMIEFVRFAAELDEGEATTSALAVCRGAGMATDDRKALRVLARFAPQTWIRQTPELLRQWAALSETPDDDVREMLRAVRDSGRFYPPQESPEYEWWSKLLP